MLNGARDTCVAFNDFQAARGAVVYGSLQGTARVPVHDVTLDSNRWQDYTLAVELGAESSLVWIPTNNQFDGTGEMVDDTSAGNPVGVPVGGTS